MIRTRHLKGSFVLATAVAAALAACGNSDSDGGDGDGDGDGDTGGTTGDGDGDGDGDTGGTTGDGDGDTGGMTGDGDGDTGGMGGGMGGMGPTADDVVDELCPSPAEDYYIVEGTEGDDTLPDFLGTTKTAVVASGGDDELGYVKYGTEEACLVAGDGNDTVTIRGEAGGTNSSGSTSDLGTGYVVLGDGADVIDYAVNVNQPYSHYRPPATIADFESGVDTIRFELEANRLPSTTIASSVEITSGHNAETVPTYDSCIAAKIYIDTDDGEIWLSNYCEGTQNHLLMTVQGDIPSLDDIEIYYRQGADTPSSAADQVCQSQATFFEPNIIEGTAAADDFPSYEGAPRRLTLGYDEDDVFSYPYREGGAYDLSCMIGGRGDDTFDVEQSPTSLAQALLMGGMGADVFDYATTNDGTITDGPGERPAVIIRDFTSGVDKLRFSQTSVDLISTAVAEAVQFSATDFTGGTVQAYESCDNYLLVVDQTDGEVWMSRNYCENTDNHNQLLIEITGDVPTADDIEIY